MVVNWGMLEGSGRKEAGRERRERERCNESRSVDKKTNSKHYRNKIAASLLPTSPSPVIEVIGGTILTLRTQWIIPIHIIPEVYVSHLNAIILNLLPDPLN